MKSLFAKFKVLAFGLCLGSFIGLGQIATVELGNLAAVSFSHSPSAVVLHGAQADRYATAFVQPAHAGALTDYAENKIVDAVMRGQTLGAPATWYASLYTVCPTDSTAGTEVSGGGYARVAITASLANWAGTQSSGSTIASSGTSGTTSNNAVIPFPTASGSWGTIACWGLTDASTAGNLWIYTTVTTPPTITTGATPSFAAGAMTIQIDN